MTNLAMISAIFKAWLVIVAVGDVTKARSLNRSRRIVHGYPVVPHSQPWQASLQYQNGYHICGGTLVAPSWVLTAAHCVDPINSTEIRVVLGEHKLSLREGPEQIINITTITVSPFFDLVRPDHDYYMPHDLAMLRLASPAQINTYVTPLQLPSQGTNFTRHICTAAGWGATWSDTSSDVLLQADLAVIDNAECRLTWREFIYYGNICAYGVFDWDVTPCEGDSGSPLVCTDKGTPLLAGVSSWGHPDCAGFPAVYTRISENLRWILEVMQA